jgi:hypothetical protein
MFLKVPFHIPCRLVIRISSLEGLSTTLATADAQSVTSVNMNEGSKGFGLWIQSSVILNLNDNSVHIFNLCYVAIHY